MELNGYRLLLPEGTLDYFDLVDVKESVNEVVIYLEEKNIVPEKYTDQDTESKGFYDPVIVQDFPLRGKKVFLNIRRRRWLLKKHNEYISRNWRMVAERCLVLTQDLHLKKLDTFSQSSSIFKEDLLATKRKILNNNRIIKAFTLSILICILLRNDIFLLKIDHNFIYAFLHINKIKVI